MRLLVLLLAALALGGCVSAFPDDLTRSVNRALGVGEVHRDPGAYLGQRVMVGGEILATRPKPGETEIELLGRRLRRDDSPDRTDDSEGRALIRTTEFLDPAVYAQGRRITVIGAVTGEEERKIGELPYRYPVITAERIRLWPRAYAVAPDLGAPYPWGFYSWGSGPYYPWPYRYRLGLPPPWWPYWR